MMLAMRARPPSAALGRLVGAAMFAALAAPGVARAEGEVEACVRASDQGQQLRDEGQLSAAKAAFIRCARPACPTVVRNDCGQWLAGVNARLPTVVPALKDETGADVLDAKVSVDDDRSSRAWTAKPWNRPGPPRSASSARAAHPSR